MFLNDEVMKKADCMRITFHTVGPLYCFYLIISSASKSERCHQ